MDIREYVDERGRCPFRQWFERLDRTAAAKVYTALVRLGEGNVASLKSVGGGLYECRISFGPGYRLYFGYDGASIVILLAGGTKQRQSEDIDAARKRWSIYQSSRRSRTWH
ncbi:MAG: type II toxin-antitoxin system RelE/ParE family toxin [Alphaproteobacteria bacterium]|nr:type II toxin-antitoxin system RelE/ParE family toxin [Alphaproteobacteria bacterium]